MRFLINNMGLVALVVMSGGFLLWQEVTRLINGGGADEIGTLQATQFLNRNGLVLDVRDAAAYAAGHIPNSRHIPLAELEQRLGEIAKWKSKPVVVSCNRGMQSGRALKLLRRQGFAEVYSLKGGIGAWTEASLPLQKG